MDDHHARVLHPRRNPEVLERPPQDRPGRFRDRLIRPGQHHVGREPQVRLPEAQPVVEVRVGLDVEDVVPVMLVHHLPGRLEPARQPSGIILDQPDRDAQGLARRAVSGPRQRLVPLPTPPSPGHRQREGPPALVEGQQDTPSRVRHQAHHHLDFHRSVASHRRLPLESSSRTEPAARPLRTASTPEKMEPPGEPRRPLPESRPESGLHGDYSSEALFLLLMLV